jgi:hypothetical protein
MSGQQHIDWFEISQRALGRKKLDALQIRMARSDKAFDAVELFDQLKEMADRKRDHG